VEKNGNTFRLTKSYGIAYIL